MLHIERCSQAACLILIFWPGQEAAAQHTEPFRTRNLSPLISIFGLPSWEPPVTEPAGELALVGEMGSHFRLAQRGDEQLILDGETWRTSLYYRRRIAQVWSLGFELPLYRHSGGVLDDLIDAWHSFFQLPDGNRNRRPEDRIEFNYADGNGGRVSLNESVSALGDVQLSFGRAVNGEDGLFLRGVIKLPTGDPDNLTGSGGVDVTVTLFKASNRTWRGHPAGFYWGVGAATLGEPDLFAERSRHWGALALLGGSWQPFPKLGMKVQADFNSPLYDSALDELGRAAGQVSLGGWWKPADGRVLEFAIIEDLIVRSSPDVVVHVGFRWDL